MFDNPMNYGQPIENTPRKFGIADFLIWIYVAIGIATGITWPVWLIIMVTS